MDKVPYFRLKPQSVTILYSFITWLLSYLLYIPALVTPKLRLFVDGRKSVWNYLKAYRLADKKLIWLHAASLGEFEQGLPVLEQLRDTYPDYQYLITFFSPSGYEVKKDKLPGYGVCYLPLDTLRNTRKFLDITRPDIALFVKYEVWPNYFRNCKKLGIPLLMISAIFKPEHIYFNRFGGFLREALNQVTHFYVQNQESATLLLKIGLSNITISGDTRFDRVMSIKLRDNHLDFMSEFKNDKTCLVAGSTWPEDEKILFPFLEEQLSSSDFCAVIAPHQTDKRTVDNILKHFKEYAVALSLATPEEVKASKLLVVDSIGLLTRIYAYADIAYVGGGFATGLHNTLEPAVFGIPVIIGPKYKGFIEAEALVKAGGVISVSNPESSEKVLQNLLFNPEYCEKVGMANRDYIAQSTGATMGICDGIKNLLNQA